MTGYPAGYTKPQLMDMLESNNTVPDITDAQVDRLLELARRRADNRGEDTALDDNTTDCLIATTWYTFADNEFGHDTDGNVNQFALGVPDMGASLGQDATLFTNTHVVQTKWLESGDGRCTKYKAYIDPDYADAETGNMWIPRKAQDWVTIIKLDDELLHDEPTAAEAM